MTYEECWTRAKASANRNQLPVYFYLKTEHGKSNDEWEISGFTPCGQWYRSEDRRIQRPQ